MCYLLVSSDMPVLLALSEKRQVLLRIKLYVDVSLIDDLLIIYMYSNSEVSASEIKGWVYCLFVSKTADIGVILLNLLPSVGIDLPKPISSVHLNRWVPCAKTNPQCVNKQWPTGSGQWPGGKTNYYFNNLFLKN